MQEPSIFTKIINGDLPSHKLYEDDKTLAFLTIAPVREGHALVIPKVQVDQYVDVPDEYYAAVWQTVKKVAAKIKTETGKDRVGILVRGLDVPHFHVHLIPFNPGESLHDGDGEAANQAELAATAEKLHLF